MKKAAKLPTSLPRKFHKFFWDVDAGKVNPSKNPKYVINRLLDKGDLAAARWVLQKFSHDLIIDTLKTLRDFSFRTAYFWANFLSIPMEEIKCMREPYRTMRKTHWLD